MVLRGPVQALELTVDVPGFGSWSRYRMFAQIGGGTYRSQRMSFDTSALDKVRAVVIRYLRL